MKKVLLTGLLLLGVSTAHAVTYPLNYYQSNSGYPPNIPTAPQLTMSLNDYLALSGNPPIPQGLQASPNLNGVDNRVSGGVMNLNRQTMPQDGYGVPDTTSPRMDDEEIR